LLSCYYIEPLSYDAMMSHSRLPGADSFPAFCPSFPCQQQGQRTQKLIYICQLSCQKAYFSINPSLWNHLAWSCDFYPSNGILRKEKSKGNNYFKKTPWASFQCNFLKSCDGAFDKFDSTAERILMEFSRFFGPFLTQMGPKVDFGLFFRG